ncbi:MAG: efflux RND transporter periplasmic adaptor subunit [Bacteroidia bacterium]|nr:efflux RND transporter periplasmic adaptor subunit [Bacteroidia bacterium]
MKPLASSYALVILACAGALLVLPACQKAKIKVQTATAETRTIYARVSESGTIQPTIDVPVAPDVSGEVVQIAVREGAKVKKGDLLLSIRPDDYKAQVEQAEASLNRSQAAYLQAKAAVSQSRATLLQDSVSLNRSRDLFRDKVISQAELESAQLKFDVSRSQLEAAEFNVQSAYYQVRSAEASRKQARQSLDRTNIYASMDGTITKLNVELGQRVVGTMQMAGTEILKIADLSRMEVVVEINENDIVNVNIGDSAQIEVDAYPGQKFYGKVAEIAYSAKVAGVSTTDQVTNFEVKIQIDSRSYAAQLKENPGSESPFRPGMTALAEIYTRSEADVVAIPIQAVTLRGKEDKKAEATPGTPATTDAGTQEVVFLLSDGKTQQTAIETGIADDAWIQVKSGLKAGDEVVTGPYSTLSQTLRTGMEVEKSTKAETPETKP